MSKRKTNEASSHAASRGSRKGPEAAGGKSDRPTSSDGAIRETVESVVIAIVLAFLFRTFEAEAFVIPTGSMATTLMGRHKDLYCPQCHAPYQANAAGEVDPDTNALRDPPNPVVETRCQLCQYPTRLGIDIPKSADYESYNGDRLIVDKLAYEIRDPKRWDIVVFKFPGKAQMNYIKRLVGLPGETIRIQYGDVFIKGPGKSDFVIERKPPDKLAAIMQTVYDADYPCAALNRVGWPQRWQSESKPGGGAWQRSADDRSFSVDGKSTGPAWLRYHHYVPTPEQWESIQAGRRPDVETVKAQLVTDFSSYNASVNKWKLGGGDGYNWTGDLAVECELVLKGAGGKVVLELVRGGRTFTCTIHAGDGEARLSIAGLPEFQPIKTTRVKGPGTYRLRFANVDRKLHLWVNGSVVKFEPKDTTYPDLANHTPTAADLSPVGINVEGVEAELRHLRLRRDLHYIAATRTQPADRDGNNRVDFELAEDQFFVLGDNSPSSADGRLWDAEHYVSRQLLIGKALFVFWPHSWDRVEIGQWRLWFPFFPNFARMRFVR